MMETVILDRSSVEHALRENLAALQPHAWPVEEIQSELEPDPADQQRADNDRDVAAERLEHESEMAHEIQAALAKLRAGTYGRCEECGGAIPHNRLVAVPWARRCVACQNAAEGQRTCICIA